MCVSPIKMKHFGHGVGAPCRKCWQCVENRKNDLLGRCIAESQHCVGASVITLTYGNSPNINGAEQIYEAQNLTYDDVQRYLKRVRRADYPLRYMLAGEYGAKKGRAHWHIIAFWQERIPDRPLREMADDPYWTPFAYGGGTFWDEFSPESASYVCKYLSKADPVTGESSLQKMSTNPPLGARYFGELADRYVDQMLVPRNPEYSFQDVKERKTGGPRVFRMSGATLDLFCTRFVWRWREKYKCHPLDKHHSDLILEFEDRRAQRGSVFKLEKPEFVKRPTVGTGIFVYGEEVQPAFDQKSNAWFYVDPADGVVWWWTYDHEGRPAWAERIVDPKEARARRERVRKSWGVSARPG